MRTLHFYLTRQVVASLLVAVAVFAFVLLLGNVLKQILALLVSGQVSLGTVVKVIVLLVPYVLVFALPMGLLTATLLVFGRFSADQELTAMRASGISLTALVTPILLLGAVLCVLSGMINLFLAPQCRLAYKSILRDAGMKRLAALLQEKTFIKDFPEHIVYIGDIDGPGTNLQEVLIYELSGSGELESYVRASEGEVVVDRTNALLHVSLRDAWRVSIGGGWRDPHYASEVQLPPIELGSNRKRKPSLTEMTVIELFQECRDLEKHLEASDYIPDIDPDPAAFEESLAKLKRQKHDLTLPVKVQIHRQFSFSFACLGFALLGIPLGIQAHRRETTFGITVALILVLIYYSFFILGQALETRAEWGPHLILWLPNFIFQAVGGVLLWRVNRGA